MVEKNKPKHETLEDILIQMESEKDKRRHKIDWSKYIPIGWRWLTDEQRAILQDQINRYIEINKKATNNKIS